MKYSKFTDAIPTRAFLVPLDEDEEVEVEISKGNIIHIKYRAMGELQPNGTRSLPHLYSCFTRMLCSFWLIYTAHPCVNRLCDGTALCY